MYESVAPRKLYEDVVEQIQNLVVGGQLRDGEQLPTAAELSQEFGVSRTVIREAIQVLRERGLVEIRHGEGTFVREPNRDILVSTLRLLVQLEGMSTMEMAEARDCLESEICALAAERATPANMAALETSLRQMEENLDNARGFIDADAAYHYELARSTQNKVLAMLLAPVVELMTDKRESIFYVRGAAQRALQCHRVIYECVKSGRQREAREAMHQHIQQVRQEIGRLRSRENVGPR